MSETQKDLDTFFPAGKEITIAGKQFIVKPFVLKNRIKVIRLFSKVFMEVAKNPDFRNLTDLGAITSIIDIAGDGLKEVYSSVLDIDITWLEENLDLKSEVLVLKAIIEVNDIPLLLSQIQEMVKVSQKSS